MKEIVIIGAGDFGKEVAWLIEDVNKKEPAYIILGFLDDDEAKAGTLYKGYEVIGKTSHLTELNKKHHAGAVIAMQDSTARKRIVDALPDFHDWETLIHPSVSIADSSSFGRGCIFCAGTNVSVDTKIGDHCIFNLNVTVGHDGHIGDFASLMSGAVVCGHATIGEHAYLSSNCTVIPGRKIGAYARVGAGSVVIRNVKDGVSVMGVPATKYCFMGRE